MCAGALAAAGGCAGTALRRFGAVSRAVGKCVPVLFCSSQRNFEFQPLLRSGVSSQMVLGDVLVLGENQWCCSTVTKCGGEISFPGAVRVQGPSPTGSSQPSGAVCAMLVVAPVSLCSPGLSVPVGHLDFWCGLVELTLFVGRSCIRMVLGVF